MEVLAILLGIVAIVWLLAGPVVTIVLWMRVYRLEERVRDYQRSGIRTGELVEEFDHPEEPSLEEESPLEIVFDEAPPPKRDPFTAAITPRTRQSQPSIPSGKSEQQSSPTPPSKTPSPPKRPASVHSATKPVPDLWDDEPAEPADATPAFNFEELLAGKWLTWVGAIAVVIGVGFFFRYSIETGLLGEGGRVAVGLLAGMSLFAGGAYAMLRDYQWLAQSLVGAAAGVLYFSLYAAFQWYGLIPQPLAFFAMVIVTASSLGFAGWFDLQPTAVLGLIGGFLTPLMLSTGTNNFEVLFSYLLLLNAGVLTLSGFRRWHLLQGLAFGGTVLMWIGWLAGGYSRELLRPTLVLMTLFFFLFALMGVWHNILRKKPAVPADFILILGTPIVYFAGLYGLTLADYSAWHGILAVLMGGIYLSLGLVALGRHPDGRPIIIALCGVAASFLTIAIPLQLSGHWIAIAWAAEALLLFELGLRFNEIRLRAAGFAMLTIVQIILAFYVSATVDDPRDFRTTRFLPPGVSIADTLDPAYGVRESAATTTAREPSWADVFNGRSFSFLASAIVMAVMAWEYRRREQSLPAAGEPAVGEGLMTTGDQWDSLARIDRSLLSGWLIAGMAVTVLGVLMIETFVAGHLRNWTVFSFVSAFAVWAAVIAVAIVLFATREGPAWLCRVGLGIFAVAAVMLGINAIATVGEVLSGWGSRAAAKTAVSIYSTPLWNPRGLSFLIGAAALTVIAFEIRKMTLRSGSAWDDSSLPQSDLLKDEEERFRQLQSGGLIAGVAVTLLVAVSIETLVAGQSWNWTLTSVLSGLTFWMFLFGAGLATFSVWKGPRWLSNVGLGGFGLAAVMLTANAIGTLSGFRGWWSSLDAAEVASTIYRLPILNPRGLSFLWGIGCCLAVLVLLRRAQKQEGTVAGSAVEGSDAGTRAAQHRVLSAQAPGSVNSPIDGPLALGLLAYLSGLTMLTIEVYAHGVVRGWASGTNLAATFVWIVYAMATLAGGLVFRSSLLRQLALGLFLLTTAKVFLYDIWQLNRAIRTFSFVGLGATLLMVSFLYRRYRDRIHAWINPAMLLIAAGGMLAVASPSQIFADDAPPIWTRLSHRWPITTPENPPETDPHSLYRIPLPLTLYGIAHPDLSDIRILPREPAGKDRPEVPYVLESFPSRGPWAGSDTPGKTIPLRILKSTHDENAGRTVLLLDAELHRLPMRELRVEVEGTAKYSRPVTLRAANHLPADDTPSRRTTSVSPVVPATANWRTIHTGKLVRKVTADGESKTAPLTFMQSSARYLELTIHDGDDAPLNVTGAAVGLTEFSLLITQQSFAEAGTALAIHAGGEQLASPEYDLVRTMDRSRIATAAELSTREVEPNPLYSLPPPPPTPWTEQNAGLVWTITIAGVIILGMVTVLILRAAARSQSTQESGSEEQQ